MAVCDGSLAAKGPTTPIATTVTLYMTLYRSLYITLYMTHAAAGAGLTRTAFERGRMGEMWRASHLFQKCLSGICFNLRLPQAEYSSRQ